MAKKKRYRVQHKFWLNALNPIQNDLIAYCEELKSKANEFSFAETIRDGLLIIRDLRLGRLDVMKRLFPELYEKLYLQMEADVMERHGVQSLIEIQSLLKLMRDEQNRPKQIVTTIQNMPQRPNFDNDEPIDLEVTKAKSNVNATANFLRSMSALTGEKSIAPDKPKPSGGIQSLSNAQFAVPDFDDD